MSTFCNLEEAFMGPIVVPGSSKKKKRRDGGGGVGIEHFVPAPLSSTPVASTEKDDQEESDKAIQLPSGIQKLQAGGSSEMESFFPLPGETAEPEEWQKAFVLQPSQIPQPLQQQLQRKTLVPVMSNGAVSVNGQSTLWRQIPEPVAQQPVIAAPIPSEINRRLDSLTRQLESLTTPTPLQSTAELFLFVAIGLLILLAIDSLLRFASGSIQARHRGGRIGGGRIWRGRFSR